MPPFPPEDLSRVDDSDSGQASTVPLEPTLSGPDTLPGAGARLGDFELIRVVGEGTHGKVFLANQLSLDRLVALKVAAGTGNEAKTMATLEHDSIVQVFSETIDPRSQFRLLCMQYVDGTALARVIEELGSHERSKWSGRLIMEIIDRQSVRPSRLDPVALRHREKVSGSDFFDTVCIVGAQLAEALAYAHRQGVLHRDVKPGNILLNQYGQVMLADFSVSSYASRAQNAREGLLGGTLPYMAPEHLDAFWKLDSEPAIAEPADIFSFGVMLFEFLTGTLPFPVEEDRANTEDFREMAQQRRTDLRSLRDLCPDVPAPLERVVLRCLEPEPEARFQEAEDLARALRGCREIRQTERELPPGGWLTQVLSARPLLGLILLALVPHLLGSVVNITFNTLQIVNHLTEAQRSTFLRLVIGYNLVAYPGLLVWGAALLAPCRRAFGRHGSVPSGELPAIRRQVLKLPRWVALLSSVGWFPGAVIFPVGIHLFSEPLPSGEWGQFAISFTLSGLIALTYSWFAVEFVALRIVYPYLWSTAWNLRTRAAEELGGIRPRLVVFRALAGFIPLTGAILMVTMGTEPQDDSPEFRIFVAALILLGMAGFSVANRAGDLIRSTVAAFTGTNA